MSPAAALKPVTDEPADVIAPVAEDSAAAVPLTTDKAAPLCRLSGAVAEDGQVTLSLEREPGALLRVLGDRAQPKEGEPAPPFSHYAISDLLNVALGGQKLPPGPLPADRVNAMLQAVAAFEPTNELEGMIAVQAVALHHAAMDCLQRSMRAERTEFRTQHLGQANKCSRTFATLLEALNRCRGKTTTQRVIVENVNVNAGGQAVVGAVAGVGQRANGADQAHGQPESRATREDGESAQRPALPSPQQIGQTVSAACVEGKEALSHARRRKRKRRATGQSKQLEARPLDRTGDHQAPNDSDAAAKRSGPDRLEGDA